MSKVNRKQLVNIMEHITSNGYPLLIRGRHGIGKSELVYQQAKKDGKPVVEIRASVMSEGDLTGLPFKGPEFDVFSSSSLSEEAERIHCTKYGPPEWFLKACVEPVWLFLDEVDRGSREVRQGFFQINDSRQLNGYKLHPETRIVACVNGGGNWSGDYHVDEMDPAELDRYAVVDFEPTIDEWLDWARGNVHSDIVLFFSDPANQQHLEHLDIHEPGKKYPSRRSWARVSNVLQSVLDGKPIDESNRFIVEHLLMSQVGDVAAAAFVNFCLSVSRVVTPESVLVNGRFDILDVYTIIDHRTFLEKVINEGWFDTKLHLVPAKNLGTYFAKLPETLVALAFRNMAERSIDNIEGMLNFFEKLMVESNQNKEMDKILESAFILNKIDLTFFENEQLEGEEEDQDEDEE